MFLTERLFVFGLCAATITAKDKGCGSFCGYSLDYPVITGIRFNLDNCDLYESTILKKCLATETYCEGLYNVTSFSSGEVIPVCTNHFEHIQHYPYNDTHFNGFSGLVEDPATCSGSFQWDFSPEYGGYSGKFSDARVLCNSGEILALLVKDPRSIRSYALYYQTSTDLNKEINYDLLSAYIPLETGQYCLPLFDLMSSMLVNLKNCPANFTLPSACGPAYRENNEYIDGCIVATTTPPPPGNTPPPDSTDSSNSTVLIAVVAGIVCVILIGVGVYFYRRHLHRKDDILPDHDLPPAEVPRPTAPEPDDSMPVVRPDNMGPCNTRAAPFAPVAPPSPVATASPEHLPTRVAPAPPEFSETKETLPDGSVKMTKVMRDANGVETVEVTIY